MNTSKKAYTAPSLTVHGSVGTITQQGGPPIRVDVPFGTPLGDNGITDVTS
ncbi:hypothetical protein NIES4071_28900 [Calothrix sp. NIES-4071]|nr:hypothetical protein NIES4071_28900 [Calothrix sp. NIES-4071]BAZ57211.1 hypothetical protein NIES4105_28840 [Calothrix sp. NIES-4105]